MQLLIEEFFKKFFNYINGINVWIIKLPIKFMFYLILAIVFGYIFVSAYKKNYFPIIIFLGILILAETAHYLRKTREKAMTKKATEINNLIKNPKNEKSKNKSLLKNKNSKTQKIPKKIINTKPVKIIKTNPIKKETTLKRIPLKKIDKSIILPEKPKNKTLLNTSKPKNKDLLLKK